MVNMITVLFNLKHGFSELGPRYNLVCYSLPFPTLFVSTMPAYFVLWCYMFEIIRAAVA